MEVNRATQPVSPSIASDWSAEKNAALLRNLVHDSPLGLALVDTDLRCRHINPRLTEIHGQAPDYYIGKSVAEVLPQFWPILEPIYRKVIATGEAVIGIEVSGEVAATPGKVRHWSTSHYPVRSDDGTLMGVGVVVSEIADRKPAGEPGQGHESRFRALLESSWDGIVLGNARAEIIYASPEFARMLGYPADELVMRNAFDFIHPDDLATSQKVFEAIQGSPGKPCPGQQRMRRKDGDWRWVEFTATNWLDDPTLRAIVVNFRDITERKLAQQRIEASERRFRALVESSWDGVLVANEKCEIIYVSPAAERIAGRSEDELTGRVGFNFIHPDDDDAVRQLFDRALRTPCVPFTSENRIRHRDGSYRWVEFRLTNLLGEPSLRALVANFRDITERKEAEQRIAASERRFRALVESSWDGLYLIDASGRPIYSSPTMSRLLGYSAEEFRGLTAFDLVHPDNKSEICGRLQRILEAPGAKDILVYRVPHKDGSLRWHEVVVTNQTHDPDIGAIVFNFHDITEVKEAEDLRRAAEEATSQLLAIVEGTEDAIIGEDRAGTIIGWNPGAERLYGYKTEEMLGRHISILIPPECSEEMLALKDRVWRGERVPPFETVRRHRDGSLVEVSISISPVRDRQGQVIAISKIAHDITVRKRAEQELLLRDRAMQAVLSGIVIADANQPDLPIIYANPAFERITGYPAPEVIGKNCRFLQGKDTDPRLVAEIRTALAARRPCEVELVNYRKDGTPFWNHLAISPLHDRAGRVTHYIGVQTDVTERKQLEQQFRQAQKMEAVGRLAGGVAHDFNNLLTIINGYTEMLVQQLPPNDPMREMISQVHTAGERAGSLTKQLLVFSRQSVLEPKVLDINDVVAETEKMLRRLIGEDIHLTTALAAGLPPVKVDPGQLQQALINLAVNARDAMPQGGSLTVETRDVNLTEEQCRSIPESKPGRYSMLAVTDTGIGMDEATKARIFEPFFTTKEPGKGTGLGLAMVHGFVKSSGGHIAVSSEPGLGATFQLYFPPIRAQASPGKSTSSVAKLPRGSETILLVEDDDAVRALTRHVLLISGYTVLAASDGQDALRVAREHDGPIHLLITDVVMPRMGGRQVAEEVKVIKPGVRVLYCSGYTDDAVVRHGVLEAETAFIHKPYSPALLAQKVRDLLDSPQ